MKPKNKNQREIVALDKLLPKLTDQQKQYGYTNCLPHIATRSKTGKHNCLDCGFGWSSKEQAKKVVCPSCKANLEVSETRKRSFKHESYYSVITSFEGYQVIRMCLLSGKFKVGQKADLTIKEVFRNWINAQGEVENIGNYVVSRYYDRWGGEWELRSKHSATDYSFGTTVVYPKFSVTKSLKRNGFKGGLHKINPYTMFTALLKDNKFETLYKAKEYGLLRYYDYKNKTSIDKYWNSIKIALRHNYKISDASIWIDYLDLLTYYKKDLRNPKFVCPDNLIQAHNVLMTKRRKQIERERREQEIIWERERRENAARKRAKQKERMEAEQQAYNENKGRFFDLSFSSKNIEISVLNSVEEFLKEGDELNHCLFVNEYYLEENSLIFSAKVNGERTATIEFSLENFTILQCRGANNLPTTYDNEFINMINENVKLIKKRTFTKEKQQIAA